MAENKPPTRTFKDFQGFPDGVNSFLHPTLIKDTQVRWAENAVCKGGQWQTRPGLKTTLSLCLTTGSTFYNWWVSAGQPPIHPQFFTIFQPTNDDPYAVFAISGTVFAAKFLPHGGLDSIQIITQISFDPSVSQIAIAKCVKSADLVGGKIVVTTPRNVLMMQDGVSRAAFWDGVSGGHLNPQVLFTVDSTGNTIFQDGYNETKIGKWMAWSGNRLWVFNGTQGYASDINDPLHFTEATVLTQVPVFNFPEEVTSAIDRGTSGVLQSLVFVFTRNSVFTLWSGIQDRTQWVSTPDFQKRIFNGVGCVAGKSPVNHMGLLYWYSESGIVALDSFGTVTSTQALPPIDSELSVSKRRISPDKSLIASGLRDSYVFWSVPMGPTASNGRAYNNHTQVLDRVTVPVNFGFGSIVPYGVPSWQGVWTGIRPIEWSTASIFGQTRTYCMSMDFDNTVRIWESFQGNRCDNGQEIDWSIETKSNPVTDNPFSQSVFRNFRILLDQINGNLSINGSWKGLRGQYHQLLDTSVTATPGSVLLGIPEYTPIINTTSNESFRKQFRDIKSKDNRAPDNTCQSTGVESTQNDGIDRAFSLLLKFSGVGAVLAYRIGVDAWADNIDGAVVPPETGFHILPEQACPELVPGDTPDFTIQDDFPQEAFVPYGSPVPEVQYISPVAPCP